MHSTPSGQPREADIVSFDHDSDPNFLAYYSSASVSDATLGRFKRIRDNVLRLLSLDDDSGRSLHVADIGCGAGTFSRLWAELGHEVHGLDVNGPLIEIARMRASEAGFSIEFDVGSATRLPYPDGSMNVVLLPELLEHVADWQSCLNEAARVLAPGGILYLSTTNVLCPKQDEFHLPLYSWYPSQLKRYYEQMAVTTRPELVNHAKYPAVNWFSFFGLRDYLDRVGLQSLDRFDAADMSKFGSAGRAALWAVKTVPLLRFAAHVLTSGVTLFAIKRRS
ncbi:class I SAM-dependent methyltransferase [Aromatoleum aromaticum]|uniref:class I SAM-dependent methyltransferase n=1 Tax=Aromatoleum aromaticum TaxID=551760 RepID=UPI001459B7A2|nr:class I SAM-dependent methyltransferase [Aromatoleum aromaticum]NMG56084.1 methyltransferase domain-containing protein [Aromatoleum aromaticum]